MKSLDQLMLNRRQALSLGLSGVAALALSACMKIDNFVPEQYNEVKGQPFSINELVKHFEGIINQ